MEKAILILLLIFPLMLGIAEILHKIKLWIIGGKFKGHKTMIILLNGEFPQRELYQICEKIKWNGKSFANQTVVLHHNLNENQIKECADIASKQGILFYSINEFLEMLRNF